MPSQRRGSLRGSLRGSSFGESGSAAASSELKSCGGAAERGSARTAACGSGDSARPVGDACHQRAVPAAPAASASAPRIVPRGILSRREGKRSGPQRVVLGWLRRARTGSGLHEELDDGSQGLQHANTATSGAAGDGHCGDGLLLHGRSARRRRGQQGEHVVARQGAARLGVQGGARRRAGDARVPQVHADRVLEREPRVLPGAPACVHVWPPRPHARELRLWPGTVLVARCGRAGLWACCCGRGLSCKPQL